MTTGEAETPDAGEVPTIFGSLSSYISCSQRAANACLGALPDATNLAGFRASAHFHFIRHTPDGDLKTSHLARELVLHTARYCLSARARAAVELQRGEDDIEGISAEIQLMARDYFRKMGTSGEVAELLLFFILETVFRAPQLVAKMELKTNPKDEVKRSDGLHFGWDEKAKQVILYIGESKLYNDIYEALDDAFRSIEKMYDAGEREEEIRLITTHFKYISPEFQKAVLSWLSDSLSQDKFRMTHVCLIGYDWKHFESCPNGDRTAFVAEFINAFSEDKKRLSKLVQTRLEKSKINHLEFQFILLPFRSVQEFRDSFLHHLTGLPDDQIQVKNELVRLAAENGRLKRKAS